MFNDEIISLIRKQSLQIETEGALPAQLLEYIYDEQLFKLFVPQALGGRMTSLPDALRIFERASWIDGSFGWLISIGAGGGIFSAAMTPSVSEEIFSKRRAVIAGSGFPSGKAQRVDSGFIVNGQWKYCSGASHATIFTANCLLESDDDEIPAQVRSFIFWPKQVEIIKDWNAFGLKATASHSIVVDHLFVPEEMTFDLFSTTPYYNDPIFSYPFVPFALSSFAVVAIGICRHFLEEAKSLAKQSQAAWEAANENRFPFVINKIEQMEKELQVSIQDFYQKIDHSWEKHTHNQLLSAEEQQEINRQCKETARVALHCGQSVFPYLGITAIMESNPINQIWRDLQTACQHSALVPYND